MQRLLLLQPLLVALVKQQSCGRLDDQPILKLWQQLERQEQRGKLQQKPMKHQLARSLLRVRRRRDPGGALFRQQLLLLMSRRQRQ